MPAKSEKQLRFIWANRRKYKNKKRTPKSMKWIWKPEWVHLQKESTSYIMSFNEFKLF